MDIERKNVSTIARTDELEHPYFALESYTDPMHDVTHDFTIIILAETELACVERRAFTDSQA